MPIVPVSRDNTVRSEGLPSVRVDSTAPLSAFGGGEALTGTESAVKGLAKVGQEYALKEKQDAENVRNMSTALDMSKIQTDLNIKLKNMHGQDALGAPEIISKEWKDRTDKIYDGLSTNYQREYFNRERNAQAIDLYNNVQNHVAVEQTQLAKDVYHATINNQVELSADIQDPQLLNQHIDGIKGIITSYGEKFGQDKEQVDENFNKFATKSIDTAVTTRLLQTGDEKQAQELLDSVSHNISTDDYMKLSYKLERGAESLRKTTQRNIDINQNKNALTILTKLSDKSLNWTNLNKIDDLDVPESFKLAAKDAVLKQIDDISHPSTPSGKVSLEDAQIEDSKDELFARHLADVLNSGDQEKIISTMSDTLRNYGKGTISQEHMNILVRMAIARGNNLPIRTDAKNGIPVTPTQVSVDAGAKSILDWQSSSGIKDTQTYNDYLDLVSKGSKPMDAYNISVRNAIMKAHPSTATQENPSYAVVGANDTIRVTGAKISKEKKIFAHKRIVANKTPIADATRGMSLNGN